MGTLSERISRGGDACAIRQPRIHCVAGEASRTAWIAADLLDQAAADAITATCLALERGRVADQDMAAADVQDSVRLQDARDQGDGGALNPQDAGQVFLRQV